MTLTNRLTLFFLAALAVVLAAFSIALYSLARTHLTRQVDERAGSSLDTLVAAAEIEPDGLEWDRGERTLWPARQGGPPVWAVFDSRGQEVDGDPDHVRLLKAFSAAGNGERDGRVTTAWAGGRWRIHYRTFSHPQQGIVERKAKPGEPRVPGDERYRTLVFVVAAPLDPTYSTLRSLAWCLAGVSVAVWVAAACGGRWFCRRALTPLTKMSGAAKEINANDLGGRLPVPETRDELADLATTVNDLLARLQDACERQRRFAGEASHQLRTPLTAMLGQMEVALRRDRDPGEYRRALASAVGQAGRLRRIVEALLFLARADAEARLPGLDAVELAGWLTRHVAEAWSAHPRYGDLRLEGPGRGALPVLAEPTLLGQAVDNLIDNAFKYSTPGSPVHVRLGAEPGEAVIVVKDEGTGIEATDVRRVFDPFFRSEEARRRGVAGVGLGLAVAERIVKGFGGRVEARSEPGHGSSFTTRLPLHEEPKAGSFDDLRQPTIVVPE